jgi:hypothetical protein
MLIKKRFGKRNFVQYLHLRNGYSIIPTPKKKQTVYLSGYDTGLYKRSQADKIALQHQALNQKQKFFKSMYDPVGLSTFAKPLPPKFTSYDHLMQDYDTVLPRLSRHCRIKRDHLETTGNQVVSLKPTPQNSPKNSFKPTCRLTRGTPLA